MSDRVTRSRFRRFATCHKLSRKSPVPSRGRRGEADTNYRDQTGTRGPRMLPTFLYFAVVVIYRVDGTCGQRPSCRRRSLLCFLPFPLPIRPCWGGKGGRKYFYRGSNPFSAALEVTTRDTDNVMVLLISHGDQNMLRLFIKCRIQK